MHNERYTAVTHTPTFPLITDLVMELLLLFMFFFSLYLIHEEFSLRKPSTIE